MFEKAIEFILTGTVYVLYIISLIEMLGERMERGDMEEARMTGYALVGFICGILFILMELNRVVIAAQMRKLLLMVMAIVGVVGISFFELYAYRLRKESDGNRWQRVLGWVGCIIITVVGTYIPVWFKWFISKLVPTGILEGSIKWDTSGYVILMLGVSSLCFGLFITSEIKEIVEKVIEE